MQASDPQKAIVDPSVEGTKNVLGSVERAGSSLRRFVHLSSIAAVQNFNQPEDHVFTEEDWNEWSALSNGDAYGVAKTLCMLGLSWWSLARACMYSCVHEHYYSPATPLDALHLR